MGTSSIADRFSQWELELENDYDREFLLPGIKSGFRISELVTVDQVKHVEVKNHNSCVVYGELVEKELLYQIDLGNYKKSSICPLVVSPIGAIKKQDVEEVRIIHDGSRPVGAAMNDYGSPQSVKYQTISEACELAKPGYFLSKVDLKAAYRSVPISSKDYPLTGLKWWFKGDECPSYLFDVKLPFGSNVGPGIFSRLTQSVRRMMKRRGFNNLVVYLDDFLIVESSYERCYEAQHCLIRLLRSLGFNISWPKVVGPSTSVCFLGIVIDTSVCTLSLDSVKVEKLVQKLNSFKDKVRASKRQFQSLAGSLNWACQAVRGGRYFLRRVLDLVNRLKLPSHKCRLSKGFFKDVNWWLSALYQFNGVCFYRSCGSFVAHTDACNTGAGVFSQGDWMYINYEEDLVEAKDLHINNKEVLAVVSAAERWASTWANGDVVVCTDSMVAKAIINKGTCKNEFIMDRLRKLFWLSVKYNFRIRAVHIPGAINQLADSISRLHEPGQVLHLFSLLKNWFHSSPLYVDWNYHMSSASFQLILPQIRKWSSRLS